MKILVALTSLLAISTAHAQSNQQEAARTELNKPAVQQEIAQPEKDRTVKHKKITEEVKEEKTESTEAKK